MEGGSTRAAIVWQPDQTSGLRVVMPRFLCIIILLTIYALKALVFGV